MSNSTPLRCLGTIAAVALAGLSLVACGSHSDAGVAGATPAPGLEAGRAVVRVTGLSGADVAATAVLADYPPHGARQTGGWVIFRRDSWRDALLAAQFAAAPLNASLLPVSSRFLPLAAKDLLNRIDPAGFPLSSGIKAILLGKQATDVLAAVSDRKLNAAELKAASAPALAAKLVPYRGGFAHGYAGEVLVVSDQAREYALPAGAWSAYSGDTVAFVDRDHVPAPTAALLRQRAKLKAEKPTIYLLGPASVISNGVASALREYGAVKRIAGTDAVTTAIAFARYRDPQTGFGWGLTSGPASVSLVNLRNWADATGAFMFAAAGPQAPLLLTDSATRIPASVDAYLRQLGSAHGGQGFVFGDSRRVSSAALEQIDAALAR